MVCIDLNESLCAPSRGTLAFPIGSTLTRAAGLIAHYGHSTDISRLKTGEKRLLACDYDAARHQCRAELRSTYGRFLLDAPPDGGEDERRRGGSSSSRKQQQHMLQAAYRQKTVPHTRDDSALINTGGIH